jgi:hypothetical protein
MKKLILTLTVALASVGAFAQGKIAFANNSLHLVYYTDVASGLRAADAGLAGKGVASTAMPAGVTLVADLYVGTSSSSLSLVTSTAFGPAAGTFTLSNILLPSPTFPGGTAYNFQVQIRDNAFATADAAAAGGSYSGKSIIFTTVPGSGTLYNRIDNHNAPALSTWTDGQFNMDVAAGIVGARGAIVVSTIPEPASFALAGLGIAAMTIFRRRK